MKQPWLHGLVGLVLLLGCGTGSFALAQAPTVPAGGLTFDTPAGAVGGTVCNAAKSVRTLIGGAVVAIIFIIGIFMFLAGNSRAGFGMMFTGFVGAVLLATMPTWIGTLISGCALA